jgi:hypothetical protein
MHIECNRTIEQARRDYAAGKLGKASILRVPMSRKEWTVQLSGKKGDSGMLLDLQDLSPQVFTSLDKAVATLEAIGFDVSQLQLA